MSDPRNCPECGQHRDVIPADGPCCGCRIAGVRVTPNPIFRDGTPMSDRTCAACGRKGTRAFVKMAPYYWTSQDEPKWVCRSGPACERRCNKKGYSIYG